MSRRLGKRTWKNLIRCLLVFGMVLAMELSQAFGADIVIPENGTKSKTGISYSGTSFSVQLSGAYTNARCMGSTSWVTVSGSGANYTIKVSANSNESPRSETLTFTGTQQGVTKHWTLKISQDGKPHTHSWGDWSYTSGTCTTQGSKTRRCSCGASQTESTGYNSSNHGSNSLRSVRKDPTCTTDGYTVSVCNGCGAQVGSKSTLTKLGHKWGNWTTVTDSTCSATGSKSRTCERCKTKQTDTIAKKAHTWGNWVTDTDSTCAAEGTKHRNCTKCSAKETGTIPKKEHTNTGKVKKKEATCTEDGYTVVVCSKCGAELESRIPIKAGHTWGAWKTEKEATCTATGTKSRTCAKCGKKESETLKALGHQVTGQVKTVAATCTKDGYKVIVCSRCGAEQGEREAIKAGHSWNAWVVQKEAGCETTGTKIRTCKNCSTKQTTTIPKLDHLVNGQIKTVAATCTKDGYKVVVCSRCGKEQEGRTVLKALGHNWGAWVPDKDATCHASGTKHRLCTRCNARQDSTIDQLKHVVNGKIKRVEPTCTKEGYTVVVCSLCGDEMGERGTLKPTGHSWGGWITDKEAGCETAGAKHRSCNKCGAREGGTIPKLEHQVQGQVKRVESTCTKEGYTVVVCSRCGKEMGTKNSLPLKPHSWGKWEIDKDAGCETDGTKHRNCTVCNAREDGTITKLGHSGNGQIRTVNATCVKDGYRVTVCSRCGKELGEKSVIPKTGIHIWGAWVEDIKENCEEAGMRHHSCVNCGKSEYDYPKELGHLVLGQIRTYTPDGGGEGYSVLVCSRCGKEMGYRRVFDVPETKVKIEFHISDTHGEGITQPWIVEATYKKPIGDVFPKVPSPKKYTITAWRDKDGNQYDKTTVLKSTRKLDLFPVWGNVGEYTIFFVGNGASSNKIEHRVVKYGEKYTLPLAKKLFDNGIGFEGWGTAADGGDQVFMDGWTMVDFAGDASSITLYALWNSSRTITYKDFIRHRVLDTDTLTHLYKVKGTSDYPSIDIEGLKFNGWSKSGVISTPIKPGPTIADGKDWVLTATYLPATENYAIVFYDSKRSNKDVVVRNFTAATYRVTDVFPAFDTQHYLESWNLRDSFNGNIIQNYKVNTDIDVTQVFPTGERVVIMEAVWKRYGDELYLYYGYDNKIEVKTVTEDDYVLPKPERTGYVFAGWAKDVKDRSTIVGDTYNVPKYGDKLYAIWDPIQYTIEYRDGMTGELIAEPVMVKVSDKVRATAPQIPGMEFLGWTTEMQASFSQRDTGWTTVHLGDVEFFSVGANVSEVKFVKNRATLYSYYVQKNGAVSKTNVVFHPGRGTKAPEVPPFSKDTRYQLPDTNDDVRGCTFLGWEWTNRPEGAILCKPGDYIDVKVYPGAESTIILVAKWKANNTIKLSAGYPGGIVKDLTSLYIGGTNVSTAVLKDMIPDRQGYTLTGFTASQKYHSQRYGLLDSIYIPENTDFTITANWAEDRHRIYYRNGFNPDYDGYKSDSIMGKTELCFDKEFLMLFERKGYVFVGWTLEKPVGDPVNVSSKIYTEKDHYKVDLTRDLDVYSCYKYDDTPAWDGETVKVIYDCMGGIGGPKQKEVTYKKSEGYRLSSEIPTKDGYYFEGWKTYGVIVDNNTYQNYVVDGVLRLFASWKPEVSNVMMAYYQSEYGKDVMPDYMFLTEYETTSWKKINDYCYFAIKTTQWNSSEHFKEMDSLVLVVEYKKGEWILTGRSKSQDWRKQVEYEILTQYTDDNTAATGKLIFNVSVAALNRHPTLKYLVKGYDLVSFWKEVTVNTNNYYPTDEITDKVVSKVLDLLYKAYKDELHDESLASEYVLKLTPDIYKTVRKGVKDYKSVVSNVVGSIGKSVNYALDNADELVEILDNADWGMNDNLREEVSKLLKNYSALDEDYAKIIKQVTGFSFDVLKFSLSAIVDNINYQKYAKQEIDPLGEMNVRLKTFYDQLDGLGFDSNIQKTFFDMIGKIYKAYCYAK